MFPRSDVNARATIGARAHLKPPIGPKD